MNSKLLDQFLLSENEKKWCLSHNVNVATPQSHDYPQALNQLSFRPGVLFYLGQPVWQTHQLLSVVGSRSPQESSLMWLDEVVSEFLKKNNVAIVSGGARGIDQKAHQVSLRAGRPTVVFLPSGLQQMYPDSLVDWVEPILAGGGAIVSQFMPAQKMQKRFFQERNRWIAAIAELNLLVECRRRSGTRLTAKYAIEYHKKIGVMPTHPFAAGLGGLDLIYDGADLIRDSIDLESAFYNFSKQRRADGNGD
jgi:DNA processing protein